MDDDGGNIEVVLDNLNNPTGLVMDEEEKVFYYMIGNKLYKYDSEDDEGNGIVLDNMIN